MKKLLALFFFCPLVVFGAAYDTRINQFNGAGVSSTVTVAPAANSILGFSSSKDVGNVLIGSGLQLSSGTLSASGGGTVTSVGWTGGIVSIANPTTTPAFTIAGTSGGIPYFSSTSTWASSGLLAANALVIGGGAGTAPSTTTTGTGILAFLGTPSSANFASALTDKTGTGSVVFSASPTLTGTVTFATATATTVNATNLTFGAGSGLLVNASGTVSTAALNLASGSSYVSGTLPYGNGGTGATSFTNHGAVTAGASALSTVAPGSNGNVLTSNGTDWTSAAPAGGGNVTNSGTPVSGQVAEWTGATVVQGVSTTGSGNYVRATSPTLVTPVLGTITSGNLAAAVGFPKADVLEASLFAADAGSNDTYVITLSPAITAYVTGAHYWFSANTANTGAATININGVGAKTIKKAPGGITTDLDTNDIRAGQWVDLVYDGTNMQMQSQLGNVPAGSGTVTSVGWTGGIVSIATATSTPAFTIAGTSGGIPYFASSSTWATSAALAANAIVTGGGAGVAPATVTTGTGVLTAISNATNAAGGLLTTDGTATVTGKSIAATQLTAGALVAGIEEHAITFSLSGGGSALATGVQDVINNTGFGGTLTRWTASVSPADTITFDILRSADAGVAPTASIVGGSGTKPNVASGVNAHSTSFTSWTSTTITQYDNFKCQITAVGGTATSATVTLYFR